MDLRKNLTEFNLAFGDIETTGLERSVHEIIEIGLLIVKQPGLEIIDTWETKVKPLHLKTASAQALEITKFNQKHWQKAIHPKKALEIFAKKTKNTVFVGHNPAFDRAFLEDYADKWEVELDIHYHMLDTVTIAYIKLKDQPIKNFKLSEIAKFLGIDQKKAHTALDDTKTTYEIFKRLLYF